MLYISVSVFRKKRLQTFWADSVVCLSMHELFTDEALPPSNIWTWTSWMQIQFLLWVPKKKKIIIIISSLTSTQNIKKSPSVETQLQPPRWLICRRVSACSNKILKVAILPSCSWRPHFDVKLWWLPTLPPQQGSKLLHTRYYQFISCIHFLDLYFLIIKTHICLV